MKFDSSTFAALPVIDGMRQCPEGDYSEISDFYNCSFLGRGCHFGSGSSKTRNNRAKRTFVNCYFNTMELPVFGEFKGCKAVNCYFAEKSELFECIVLNCHFSYGCDFCTVTFGDYCCFDVNCRYEKCVVGNSNNFGARCIFNDTHFGNFCIFGNDCRFHHVSFTGLKAIPGVHPVLFIGGAGSVERTTYFFNVENGPLVNSGCFSGTLDEFREKVKRDYANHKPKANKQDVKERIKRMQYLGFANIVAATWCPEKIENEHFCYLEKSSS